VGNLRGKRPLIRPMPTGKVILKWILEKWNGGMDWIDLAQYRNRWPAFVSAVMNLWVP
jgi:hypothetical protein